MKPQTKAAPQAADQRDATVTPLNQLYLAAIAGVLAADSLDIMEQDFGQGEGRYWLLSTGTTKPIGQLYYKFERDQVTLGVEMADERRLPAVVDYRGGIDEFLMKLQRFLRANRLAAPKAGAKESGPVVSVASPLAAKPGAKS